MEHVAWQEANEALDTIHQISEILDTGLDKETLTILIALLESGVNPEVTAAQSFVQDCDALDHSIIIPTLSVAGFSSCGEGTQA